MSDPGMPVALVVAVGRAAEAYADSLHIDLSGAGSRHLLDHMILAATDLRDRIHPEEPGGVS